ncbi:MAG: IPT/TIG domain-containing protein [Candidatus Staskawiczbacteria bacterium]|nr:IPT/TIG domain-containing protein [Candidatus Staskawiczbacteria bacterium]
MKIKYLLLTAVLATAIFASGSPANAQTSDIQAQIQALLQQIAQLQAQLTQLQAQQGGGVSTTDTDTDTESAWCHTFNQKLGYANSSSTEVGYLHTALDKEGISYAPDTSNTYGRGTAAAIAKFQEKYASEILAPYGLTKGTGYFGNSTRAKLNELYGCQQDQVFCTQEAKQCSDGSYVSRTGPNCEFAECPIAQQMCSPNWQCGEWSVCSNAEQTRVCTDPNFCSTTAGRPDIKQSCTDEQPPSIVCTDSDNGKDYFTKGTVINTDKSISWGGNARTDICSGYNNKYVKEYYCDASSSLGYSYTDYECSNGCEDGACKPASGGVSTVTLTSPTIGGLKYELGNFVEIVWVLHPPIWYWNGDLPVYETISPDYSLYATLTRKGAVIKKEKIGALNAAAQKPNYTASYPMVISSDAGYIGDDYKISLSCDSVSACTGDESNEYFSIVSASPVYFTNAPVISGISPSTLYKGQSADIIISGSYFTGADNLQNCGISVNMAGFTVNSCQLISSTTIKANVTISSSAGIGTHYLRLSDDKFSSNQAGFTTSPSGCTDADGGLEYYSGTSKTEGTASWNNAQGTFFDTCSGSTLREYYCSNDKVTYQDYVCPGGCSAYRCAPYINVLSPNGGESFEAGKTYAIKWESAGVTQTSIYLWGPNGSKNIAGISSSDGSNSYSWTVDSNMISLLGGTSSQYYISVAGLCSSCNVPPQDKSDNKFTITTSGTTIDDNNIVQPTAPAPVITSASPVSGSQSDGSITIDVYGTGFASGSAIKFDNLGITLSTTLLSTTHVQTMITSLKYVSVGKHPITVVNSDGQVSNEISFNVTASTNKPVITSISPSYAFENVTKILNIYGTGFQSGAVVMIDNSKDKAINTKFISSTQLQTTIITDSKYYGYLGLGDHYISIDQGGSYSNYVKFNVTNQKPSYNPLDDIASQLASLADAVSKLLGQ